MKNKLFSFGRDFFELTVNKLLLSRSITKRYNGEPADVPTNSDALVA
jgi:hypothetical protein